jgi:hypothetical protein
MPVEIKSEIIDHSGKIVGPFLMNLRKKNGGNIFQSQQLKKSFHISCLSVIQNGFYQEVIGNV